METKKEELTDFLRKRIEQKISFMESEGRKILEGIVVLDERGNIVTVNWLELVQRRNNFSWRQRPSLSSGDFDSIVDYLYYKKVLCLEGGFGICAGIITGGLSGSRYYFSKGEDAEAYRQAQFKTALYPTRVVDLI